MSRAAANAPTKRSTRQEAERRQAARDAADLEILAKRRREQAAEPTVTLDELKRRIDARRR